MRLVASGISHFYGTMQVLSEIDLIAEDGEILAIIGPSGCGKSTLLSILGGLLEPTRGVVLAEGSAPAGCLNPLTFIFQDFALLPWRNVADNVAFALEHQALSRGEREALVLDALRRTGLAEFAAVLPRQLSGGMRQRVGVARAMVVRPAILLMDEPFSALDAQTRELLIEDFLALWEQERTTAVLVTHNLAEALRVANRIVVLSRRPGKIRAVVEVPFPLAERRGAGADSAVIALNEQLWSLIKSEAITADRELAST
jgi:NitT/TauT family transport system ATP-binding protein